MNAQIIRDSKGHIFYEGQINQEKGWLYINWSGDVSLDDVKRGSEAFLDLLAISGAQKLLNNNTELTSNFLEINEWIEEEIIPKAVALGLRYFAHVLSPKFIARFSGVDLGLRVKPIEFQAFKTLDKAEKWLSSK